jgi:hypothetical protein
MRTLCLALASLTLAVSSAHAQFARFDTVTDTIGVAGQTVLGTAATFEARVLLEPGGSGSIYMEQVSGLEDKRLALDETGPGAIGFTLGSNQNSFFAPVTVSTGVFHHVAFVRDGGQERLYLDGNLVGSRSVSGDIDDSALTAPAVGARFFDATSFLASSFIGLIDTLRISNVARYSGTGFSAPEGDLDTDAATLILYNFNAEDLSGSQLADLSGNGHTGTLGAGFAGATAPEIASAVPEPGAWALMLGALAGLGLRRRRAARRLLAAAAIACGLPLAAADPVVPGYTVTSYASAPQPYRMSFDPAGVMYVGNGSNAAGGAPISRVELGGGVASAYGPAIFDPDAVLFDTLGAVSGVAGAVLVAGASPSGPGAAITVIRPDQTTFSLFGTSGSLRNPDDLAFDFGGRLLGTDNGDGDPSKRTVFASMGSAPTLLFLEAGGATPGSLAIDAGNRIYTSASDGVIRIHDATGALVDGAFVTGLGSFPAIDFARGGAFGTSLYALDNVNGTLLRLDPGGAVVVGSGFAPDAYELAFGPDEALYVALFDQGLILRIAAVPEPATFWLLGCGALALALRGARPRRRAQVA